MGLGIQAHGRAGEFAREGDAQQFSTGRHRWLKQLGTQALDLFWIKIDVRLFETYNACGILHQPFKLSAREQMVANGHFPVEGKHVVGAKKSRRIGRLTPDLHGQAGS
ncbi:hypothetical protein D9M72_195990 [compost metagenome]